MVTIVLPAYNEASGIDALLDRIAAALGGWDHPWEVLVVDDGSTDATAALVVAAARRLPVRLVQHGENQGYGRALATGLRVAMERADVVVTMDADDSHDPALVPAMVEGLAAGHDLVVASRFRPGGREVGVPWRRRMLSRGACGLLRATQPHPALRDYTSGYRAYRATLLAALERRHGPELVRERGFAAGLEVLLKARALGARIHEVPLVLRYDRKAGPSKMRVARATGRTLAVLGRELLAGLRRPPRRPVEGAPARGTPATPR